MLEVKGRTVLERQIETLRACGIQDVAVVRGYRKETVVAPAVRVYDNDEFETTGELVSLFAAEPELQGRFVFLYGDVLFERAVLDKVLRAPGDVVVAVDRAWVDQRDQLLPLVKPVDLVVTSDPPRPGRRALGDEERDRLLRIGQRVAPEAASGEFIGVAAFSAHGAELLRAAWARARAAGGPLHEAETPRQAAFTDLLQALVDEGHPVTCVSTYKGWLEIDTFEDYQRAWAEIRSS
jgi:phosphoenolpyruvate phosphomutase